jgi:hypothetical protein
MTRTLRHGQSADSMMMSALAGVGLLCYAANLYLLPAPSRSA